MASEWSGDDGNSFKIDNEPSLATELSRLNHVAKLGGADELILGFDWLKTLVNQVSDYIFVKDRNCRFVMANDQVALDIGYEDSSQLIGKSDLELHPAETGTVYFSTEREIMVSKSPKVDFEELMILPDGKRKWFSSSKFPVTNAQGEVVGIMGICRDITQRKKAELLLQGQNKVLQEIANGQPLQTVLETLVLTIEAQLDGIVGSVMLADETGKWLVAGPAPNLPKEFWADLDGIPIGPRSGSCGAAAHRRETVIVENIQDDELCSGYSEQIRNLEFRSCWSIPILGKDMNVLGTFGLYSRENRSPTEHEYKIAGETAHLASIAVERDRAEGRIRFLAHHDALTGLPNRLEFNSRLERKIAASRLTGEPVAVVFVDLDNFKTVNDSFGHSVGDEVLKIIAERIASSGDEACQAIRFGGDEFVLLVEGHGAVKTRLKTFLARLRDDITQTLHLEDLSFHVTCSLGAACFPEDAKDAAELLQNADKAMFEAKASGRDEIRIHQHSSPGRSLNKLTLLEEMRSGIARQEFFLEYQPQYDLMSGTIVGAEALVRWQHPALGRLMPGDFIGLAEESGLIVPLGRWVLNEACRQNKMWQERGLEPITVGVNVSPRQFRDAGLVTDVCEAMETSGLPAKYLELEVTETLLIQNADQAVRLMDDFRRIGLKLAIDDFGTGYSSLAALKSFPLTRLKIDQSFIRDLDNTDSDRCIARAIISLGRELGLNVVAEGVETAKQQAFLASCKCETVQGFHFGRPMSADRLGKLLAMTLTRIDVPIERAYI
ncbi:EAL domain-containing protein [Roseibium aggregatum]|uniref:EAL domain-containing protein n=1 Tax=Roseibium aggregatum TaxID=187304 RepID=A0A939EEY9_9HYPH|nr:EAL domain-containing protein [Roseibium aggregatum]MBN9670329.1 EAL domain-containing protein [Roseibium aggregatum]